MQHTLFTKQWVRVSLGIVFLILVYSALAHVAGAQEAYTPKTYTPFTPLPGVDYSSTEGGFAALVNRLYVLAIIAGSILGVLRIAVAGVRHSASDVVTTKQDAREEIKSVFFGLFILLIPAIVLSTINPQLLNLDVFREFGTGVEGVSTSPPTNALPPLQQGFGRTNCTVGSAVSESTWVGDLACYGIDILNPACLAKKAYNNYNEFLVDAKDGKHTDTSCQKTLACTGPEDVLTFSGSTRYTCTYKREIEEYTTRTCGITDAFAQAQNSTVDQLCAQRCDSWGGQITDDNACKIPEYKD